MSSVPRDSAVSLLVGAREEWPVCDAEAKADRNPSAVQLAG